MMIFKKAIPRRTALRRLGVTLALPLLDSMVPALSTLAQTAAKPINRFGVVYVPNGMIMKEYLPTTEGAAYELTPTLQPLAPVSEPSARSDRTRLHSDSRTTGRRACEGVNAVPYKCVSAPE